MTKTDLLLPALITAIAALVYLVLVINVGRARVKYGIKPPAVTGDEAFERVLRVQHNTLEQFIFFLPGLWLFAIFISPAIASILGGIWVLGRILYAWGYYQAAEKRMVGFALSSLSSMTLVLGALGAIVWQLWQQTVA
ncbi:MAG: MAPEG family protein [Synechocystis sp.]|nr:MAPEG family protein [Synechocystis sp.]